ERSRQAARCARSGAEPVRRRRLCPVGDPPARPAARRAPGLRGRLVARARSTAVDCGRGRDRARARMTEIALDELVGRLGAVAIVDVRTPQEYDGTGGQQCDPRQGHVPGAVNFDVYRLLDMSPDDVQTELGLEPGAEVVAYCHSGGRSAIATQVLRSLGY